MMHYIKLPQKGELFQKGERTLAVTPDGKPGCLAQLELYKPNIVSFRDACVATSQYRKAHNQAQSPPAIFINLQDSFKIGIYNVVGYWLYNATIVSKECFISVPAYEGEGADLGKIVPILPKDNTTENPAGLDLEAHYPCPPPPPCADDNPLTSDNGKNGFKTIFPDITK